MRKNFLKKAAVVALTTAMAFGMVPAMPATEAKAVEATNSKNLVVNFSDWQVETFNETFTKDGFTFTADNKVATTSDLSLKTTSNNKESVDRELAFTTRLQTSGKSQKGYREIQFTTSDAAKLTFYALASSETATRVVSLVDKNDSDKVIGTADVVGLALPRPEKEEEEGYDPAKPDKYLIAPSVIEIPAAGSYAITVDNGTNFYYIAVEYAGGESTETKLNGLNKDEEGNWYYYTDGDVDTSKTGLVWFSNKWCYVKEGAYCKSRALVWHGSQWWFVNNGTIDKETTGLVWHGNAWYYVSNGTINKDYEGLVWHYNNWYYVKDGKFDNTKNGLVEYKGQSYEVTNGKLYQN